MKFFVQFLLLLSCPLSLPAASLSLTSTNDYKYIQFRNNEVVDIRGIGVGKEGLYRMPRREDVFFLSEAIMERRYVCYALNNKADVIIATNAPEWISRKAYASFPNWDGTMFSLFDNWMDHEMYGTNDFELVRMTIPKNIISSPVVIDDFVGYNYYNTDGATLNKILNFPVHMFEGSVYPISNKLREGLRRHDAWNNTEVPFFDTDKLHFGYMTNAYMDVMMNSAPVYFQWSRSGQSGWVKTVERHYDCERNFTQYDFKNNSWKRDIAEDSSVTATGKVLSVHEYLHQISRIVVKKSLVAVDKDKVPISKIRGHYSDTRKTSNSLPPCITFPRFEDGTVINGVINAVALVLYRHETSYDTNVCHYVEKAVLIPTSLSYAGLSEEGYPVYSDSRIGSSEIYFTACKKLIGDEEKDDEELLGILPDNEYPKVSELSAGEWTLSSSSLIEDRTEMKIVAYFGLADVTFNARVIEN